MNLFNPAATCAKCGHDDISIRYRRSGYDCSYPRRCGMSQFDGEHHDRHCRRCGYEWAEAVMPAVDEPTAALLASKKPETEAR